MKITIGGLHGSGKSTVAKRLADQLKLTYYSMGGLHRKYAEKLGITLEEESKLCQTDLSMDKKVDAQAAEIGKTQDNFVLEGHMAFHFIPDSIKVYLDVDFDVGAKRIYGDQQDSRKSEMRISLEDTKEKIKRRKASELKRWRDTLYGVDPYQPDHYDLLINTTEETIDSVVQTIIDFLKLTTSFK